MLAEVARTDAERRRFVREIQEEVQARARGELMDSVEATAPPPPPPPPTTTPPSPPPAAAAAAPPAEDLKSVAARARGELNDATEDKSSKDDDEE